jgi:hypothetical protein
MMVDYWVYASIITAIIIGGFMYYTGRWGRERSVPGVYQADETIADNTLLISPTMGMSRLTKIKTINSANKKRMQFWDDSGEFINDDFVEDETVFPLDNKAFLVGDPFKRVLLHIPRNHWLRTQISIKDYGPVIDRLTFKCMMYENLMNELMKDYDKGFEYWTAKVKAARQAGGVGLSPWMTKPGYQYQQGLGGEE